MLEEDFHIGSGGHSEGAHPLCGPLSWWGLNIQLSLYTNQFGQTAISNLHPAPLTVWESAHSPGVRAYCYAGLAILPYRTITLAHVMSWENFSRAGFPLLSPRFRIWSIRLHDVRVFVLQAWYQHPMTNQQHQCTEGTIDIFSANL